MKISVLKIVSGLFLLTLLGSCDNTVPKGQLIKATGCVTDTLKKKNLPGIKVYLVSGQRYHGSHSSGWDYTWAVDSMLTDASGNFSFAYTAEGKSEEYAISIERTIRQKGSSITNNGYPIYSFQGHTELLNRVVYARELNFLELHLKIVSNPYDTLFINVYNNSDINPEFCLPGKSIDTTLLLRCMMPKSASYISYHISPYRENTLSQDKLESAGIQDSVFSGIYDTAVVFRNFGSVSELFRKPYYEFSIAGSDSAKLVSYGAQSLLRLNALLKDQQLKPNDPALHIVSYSASYALKGMERSDLVPVFSNTLSKALVAKLKQTKAGDSTDLYLSNVKAVNKTGDTTQLSDLWLKITR